jgi:hypothetical protein
VTSALWSAFVAVESGPTVALQQLVMFTPSAAEQATVWHQAVRWLARALLILPASAYGSAIWVLLYLSATAKVAYPWIPRDRPA